MADAHVLLLQSLVHLLVCIDPTYKPSRSYGFSHESGPDGFSIWLLP
jgi:hypothetical protein